MRQLEIKGLNGDLKNADFKKNKYGTVVAVPLNEGM
jgi:hypothetical protein